MKRLALLLAAAAYGLATAADGYDPSTSDAWKASAAASAAMAAQVGRVQVEGPSTAASVAAGVAMLPSSTKLFRAKAAELGSQAASASAQGASLTAKGSTQAASTAYATSTVLRAEARLYELLAHRNELAAALRRLRNTDPSFPALIAQYTATLSEIDAQEVRVRVALAAN